jgi:hypothetical protein
LQKDGGDFGIVGHLLTMLIEYAIDVVASTLEGRGLIECKTNQTSEDSATERRGGSPHASAGRVSQHQWVRRS